MNDQERIAVLTEALRTVRDGMTFEFLCNPEEGLTVTYQWIREGHRMVAGFFQGVAAAALAKAGDAG